MIEGLSFSMHSYSLVLMQVSQIMAVFDTLVQPPVDAFKPEGKEADIDLDTIDASASHAQEERPMSVDEI